MCQHTYIEGYISANVECKSRHLLELDSLRIIGSLQRNNVHKDITLCVMQSTTDELKMTKSFTFDFERLFKKVSRFHKSQNR